MGSVLNYSFTFMACHWNLSVSHTANMDYVICLLKIGLQNARKMLWDMSGLHVECLSNVIRELLSKKRCTPLNPCLIKWDCL